MNSKVLTLIKIKNYGIHHSGGVDYSIISHFIYFLILNKELKKYKYKGSHN